MAAPKMTMPREFVVYLYPRDFDSAYTLAREKYEFSRKIGHKGWMRGNPEDLILTDARAIMAEKAVASLMGWKWKRQLNGAGQADFVVDGIKVDVKSTVRTLPTLRIPTHKKTSIVDSPMDRFVLVSIGRSHDHAVIVGWIDKEGATAKGKLGQRMSGGYWEVKGQDLVSMEEW